MRRIRKKYGNYAKLRKILERGRLSSRLEALPRGEIIPGALDMPGTPQKSKVVTKPAEKLGRIVENQRKTEGNQTFPVS